MRGDANGTINTSGATLIAGEKGPALKRKRREKPAGYLSTSEEGPKKAP